MFVNRYPWSHLILQIEFLSRKQKVKGHNSKIMIVLILVINEDKCNENVFFKENDPHESFGHLLIISKI